MITLVWAMDENRLIGKGDRLPWHHPSDLRHFYDLVGDTPVLMGEPTYRSMKGYFRTKPLPFSRIYVARRQNVSYDDATRIDDIRTFLERFEGDLCVIGGSRVFMAAMPYADMLEITYILDVHEGDVFMPVFDMERFRLVRYRTEEKLIFATYERVN